MGLPKLTICFEIANTHVGIISKVIKHFESKCKGLPTLENSEYKNITHYLYECLKYSAVINPKLLTL